MRLVCFFMVRPPPISTRTDTHFPYTTLCRSPTRRRKRSASSTRRWPNSAKDLRSRRLNPARSAAPAATESSRRFLEKKFTAGPRGRRSEEHTSELQSLMRISYAVFCLKKKNTQAYNPTQHGQHST